MNDLFYHLEGQLIDPSLRENVDQIIPLIADDFFEFGSSGQIHAKSDVIEYLRGQQAREFELLNFRAKKISVDVVLVTYLYKSKTGQSNRSSIWHNNTGGWQMRFHQGTSIQCK